MGKIGIVRLTLLVMSLALFALCINQEENGSTDIVTPSPTPTGTPPPGTCLTVEEKRDLAEKYSPHLCFYDGFFGEEKYFPTRVDNILDHAELWEYEGDKIPDYDPDQNQEVIGDQFAGGEYYLDMGEEGCSIDPGLAANCANDLYLYYRVECVEHEGNDCIVIQYWFFYLFNDHVNDHEGEWEMILVLLNSDKTPIGAAYSRHEGGEYRPWDEISKEDTHPKVYVAEGSHGAYFDEGLFSFQSHFDVVSDGNCRGPPESIKLLSDQFWLKFAGNWGYRDWKPGFSGPHGPWFQEEKWTHPAEWAFSYQGSTALQILPPFVLFHLSCPADMLITNSAGEKLGYSDGEFVRQIDLFYAQDLDEEESYLIPEIDAYSVEIFGTGTGTFDLATSINSAGATSTTQYREIPVTPTTKAVLSYLGGELSVDEDGDGYYDFFVSPDSLELVSPQPAQPLQVGTRIIYEIVLFNNIFSTERPSTFVFDIDPPSTWEYTLSSDTITVVPGESETVYLTVIAPKGTPMQEHTIRVEATSEEDSTMSATLHLAAKPAVRRCTDFEDLPLEAEYNIGNTFFSSGVRITVEPFQWGSGEWTKEGRAIVYSGEYAGGSGLEIFTNNVNVSLDFDCTCKSLSLLFGSYGGNLNIEINDDFRNVASFSDIDGTTIGGVKVSVIILGDGKGYLELSGTIKSFAIGGQEFFVDDFCCECIPLYGFSSSHIMA